MGYFLLSLSLGLLVLSHACFAQLGPQQGQSQWQGLRGQQQHRLRGKSECRIERLTALEPNRQIKAEAGTIEVWDQNNEQFQCAGVAAFRHDIQPRGLLLPSYTNAPQIYYVIRGRGIQGTVIPGCPETYESVSQSRGQQQQQKVVDRHQKVRRIQEGDIIALPAGVAHWVFNDGETPLTCIALEDLANEANQLDANIRKFHLAGNPQGEQQQQQQRETRERKEQGQGQEQDSGNVFSGFDEQFLASIFNVNPETARKLQGQNDNRGSIVRVDREFQVLSPEFQEEEQERERERERERELNSGLSQSVCSLRLRENIAKPSRADVYTPRGGRVSSINSHNLPILDWIQLSAERGVLYRNAILAPLWNVNAHALVYILRGSGRIQIVGNAGKSVFNERVQEGQLIIVPQNFAVVKKASEEGLEWISFKTNSNAMSSPLVGRASALVGIPEDVLANAYDISREDARSLKFNRQELAVFGPGSRSQRGEEA